MVSGETISFPEHSSVGIISKKINKLQKYKQFIPSSELKN
jgi:hypothetical protein